AGGREPRKRVEVVVEGRSAHQLEGGRPLVDVEVDGDTDLAEELLEGLGDLAVLGGPAAGREHLEREDFAAGVAHHAVVAAGVADFLEQLDGALRIVRIEFTQSHVLVPEDGFADDRGGQHAATFEDGFDDQLAVDGVRDGMTHAYVADGFTVEVERQVEDADARRADDLEVGIAFEGGQLAGGG